MPTAHCVSTIDGVILAVDKSFCALFQKSESDLVGSSYKEITHPDDIEKSLRMLSRLEDRAPPIELTKRYLRADGMIVYVDLLVSLFCDSQRLVSTLSWGRDYKKSLTPDKLWQAALRIKHVSGIRKFELGKDITYDHVSEILIQIYLAEAEGRIVSTAQLSTSLDIPPSGLARWIKVLEQRNLVEPTDNRMLAVQFTHSGLIKIERILGAMLGPMKLETL
jgi:PAS domain S-box-containing protein